jgi:hypothetical protein
MSLARRVFDERRRVLLPLGIALVANLAVLVLAVAPLEGIVLTSASNASASLRDLGEARAAERRAQVAKASRDRAELELSKFYGDVLPKDLPAARQTMFWLTEAARSAGLEFKGWHFDWEAVRGSRLSRGFAKITLQGRYPNIRKFLYALETAKEFVIVEKVELAQPGDRMAANGVLSVSITVSTYYQTKP